MKKMIVKRVTISKDVYEDLEQEAMKSNCYINDIVIKRIRDHLGLKAGVDHYVKNSSKGS